MGKTFVEELLEGKKHGYAVGAFNIFNYQSAEAAIKAAEKRNAPIILQTSVKTVVQIGIKELGDMLKRMKEAASVNVLIHLDHCKDVEIAKACIDAGWDAVMFDGSAFPYEENIALTKEVVEYAHSKGVEVEGELGKIVGVEEDIVVRESEAEGVDLESSIDFVSRTGIDAYAPAIGTAHGVYKGVPKINFDLVAVLSEKLETPIVIHGGTGLSEDTFDRLIANGGSKVNVSTALKHAYMDKAKEYFEEYPDKIDPLKFDKYFEDNIEAVVGYHIDLFRRGMK